MTLEEYIKGLSFEEHELLKAWMKNPCYDCPLPDKEMADRFSRAYVSVDDPLFVARLADLEEWISDVEARLERLVLWNGLMDLEE